MTPSSITRRELLKTALAAGGGLAAAAFLPQRWVKPFLRSGVLPVHAQASCQTFSVLGLLTPVHSAGLDNFTLNAVTFSLIFPDGAAVSYTATATGSGPVLTGAATGATTILAGIATFGAGNLIHIELHGSYTLSIVFTVNGCPSQPWTFVFIT